MPAHKGLDMQAVERHAFRCQNGRQKVIDRLRKLIDGIKTQQLPIGSTEVPEEHHRCLAIESHAIASGSELTLLYNAERFKPNYGQVASRCVECDDESGGLYHAV